MLSFLQMDSGLSGCLYPCDKEFSGKIKIFKKKGSSLKGRNLLPRRANSFHLKLMLSLKRGKNNIDTHSELC